MQELSVGRYQFHLSIIDPFMITEVLHSSGTFVSGNNTLSRKMTLKNISYDKVNKNS
jgi:hypothetical protein